MAHPPLAITFGKIRQVDCTRLEPFAEAVKAYALWKALRVSDAESVLIAQRDANGTWRWCGGFGGLPTTLSGKITIRPVSKRVGSEAIRHAMWSEAVSGQHIRNADATQWKAQIEHHLPDDMLRTLFGPHGVTARSGAAHFGTTRQTLSLHLRGSNG